MKRDHEQTHLKMYKKSRHELRFITQPFYVHGRILFLYLMHGNGFYFQIKSKYSSIKLFGWQSIGYTKQSVILVNHIQCTQFSMAE